MFWTGDDAEVAQAIREIVRYQVPAVMVMDGLPLVLRTDCTVEEEVLIVLHNAGEAGISRRDLGRAVQRSAGSISNALTRLASAKRREVVRRGDMTYVLTPNGTRRVQQDLAEKLSL